MTNTNGSEPARPVAVSLDEDGHEHASSVLSSPSFPVRANCSVLPRLIVPILFVPGIMGTRLRVQDNKKVTAWAPPDNTWEGLCALLSYLFKGAATRQALLDPDNTEVDPDGPCRPGKEAAALLAIAPGKNADEQAVSRGWGALHGGSYGKILSTLELRLAHVLSEGHQVEAFWKGEVLDRQDAARFGAEKDFSALSEDELRLAAQAAYPVHAVGYNWLKSNAESAQLLASEIDRITRYYASRNYICEKVIIVTHSMGGLVARACSESLGLSAKILGVVHGVQPAIGAPATYKRMRAGFEDIDQIVLGRNAAECTAVLSHAPGPLELLPHPEYRTQGSDGASWPWLNVRYRNGAAKGASDKEEPDEALGAGDPFETIYPRNDRECWWRLVKEELIDPKGDEERKKSGNEVNPDSGTFGQFTDALNDASKLISAIHEKYHPVTYAFYADDVDHATWNELCWKSEDSIDSRVGAAPLLDDDLNGRVRIDLSGGQHEFEIDKPRGRGDGTVPAESGRAPKPHCAQIFRHEGKAKGHESYDHQHAFNAREPVAATFYSIARIAATSEWFQEEAKKP